MLIVRLAIRNARRNVTRTLLTATTVVFGTALLLVGMAWVQGILGDMLEKAAGASGHARIVDPEYADKEELMPLYANLEDTASLEELLRDQPGVTGVYPRIVSAATLTVGEEIGDVFGLVVGAPVELFEDRYRAKENVVEGSWFTGEKGEILVGASLARRAGAKPGDELVLLGQTQDGAMSPLSGTVVGIAQAGNPMIDQAVFIDLETARYFADIPDGATELLVFTDDYRDAPGLAGQLRDMPELSELRVQAWSERDPWTGMLGIVGVVQGVLVFVIVFITALGVWNTMTMSVLERTDEIGVMRAMGLSRLGAVSLFVVEALFIALIGGAIGVGLGLGPGLYLETEGITLGENVTQNINADIPISATMYANVTFANTLASFVMGLVMALVGSALPALRAASIEPVAAMKHGR